VDQGGSEGQATGAQTGTQDVFVSYASQDAALANSVVESLEQNGLRCWIAPRDVVPGSLYADEIVRAINDAKVVVLVLSEHAVASSHVGKEIERASSKRRRIIAFHTDTAPLTRAFEYFLSESQWINVETEGTDAAAAKLVEAVRRHLDLTSVGEPLAHSHLPVAGRAAAVPRTRWMMAAGVVLLLVFVYVVVDRLWLSKNPPEERSAAAGAPAAAAAAHVIPEKSVAVLPFVDMSEKKDQEYFSDGLSEELIDMLTKMPEIRVPARTSSFYFKGKQVTIAEIAKSLGVANVLEGSVRKSGNTLRITAQLIRVDSGYHVWSGTYDRQLDDIFKIQDEIADAVVKALKLVLLESTVRLTSQTSSTDAYLKYLQGVALLRRGTADDNASAIATIKQALSLNPRYAPAWALLSMAISKGYSNYYSGSYQDVSTAAREAAQQALALDNTSVDAYNALAQSYLIDWQWGTADEAAKNALALEPGNPAALRVAGRLAMHYGQLDTALRSAEVALTRDPLDYINYNAIADIQFAARRYPLAEAAYRKSYALNPRQNRWHDTLGMLLLAQGYPTAALAEYQLEPEDIFRELGLVSSLDGLRRRAEADKHLAILIEKWGANAAYDIASIYARRGDREHAFEWLERAFGEHDSSLPGLKIDEDYMKIRGDPRFNAMLRKLQLHD
jgi:TolB-like protein/tetratricopeptide (TPR) repeat protein